jgi:putative GTP pyrophosphokinase
MMLDIRQQIENLSDAPTEDDILIEKLSRLDFNME